jgi:hypothetical protein
VYIIEDDFFKIKQIISKAYNFKFDSLCNVKMEYWINKINSRMFKQQVGRFVGKKIDFHSWGASTKLHK